MEIIKKNNIFRFEDGAKITENEGKIVIRDITELFEYAMGEDSPNPILFSELYKRLVSKAQKDGVISENEKNILDLVRLARAEHDKYLDKASEDGIIDEEESPRLKTLRTQVLDAVRA